MTDTLSINPHNAAETSLWSSAYLFALSVVYDRREEHVFDDIPAFAGEAADRAVMELRKRTDRGGVTGPDARQAKSMGIDVGDEG